MPKLSLVLNVIPEEINLLPRVLASVRGLADEIVLVDMTGGILGKKAKEFDAKIYPHKRVSYVEVARNFGISKATGEWILILDPDEEVSKGLSLSIRKIINKPKADYYRIPRKNIIFGHFMQHSRWWPDYNIRLFKKNHVSWNEVIHMVPMTQGVGAEIEAKENLAIMHHHYDSIEQFVERMNRYTSVHAEARNREGYKFKWQDLIEKPSKEFLSRYFFGEGYKDGVHGLALSALQALSELVLYLKVWQIEKFREETPKLNDVIKIMGDEEKESHFWQADASYKTSGRFVDRLKRKFKI